MYSLLTVWYMKIWFSDLSCVWSCQVVLCQKRIKEQHEKDKRIYANMFQKFAERDSKVNDLCFLQQPPDGGISMFFKETELPKSDEMLIWFDFSLLVNRKKQRGWRVRARRTVMTRWRLRTEKRRLRAKQRRRWRCDYSGSSILQTFVTSAICV